MCVSKARLTVYFEPPFWVGLYQREDGDGFQVCRVVFGGEPRDQQVLDYFQSHWRELIFTPPAAGGPDPDRAVNPKRARREARGDGDQGPAGPPAPAGAVQSPAGSRLQAAEGGTAGAEADPPAGEAQREAQGALSPLRFSLFASGPRPASVPCRA